MKIREAKHQWKLRELGINYRGFINLLCVKLWDVPANWDVDPSIPPLYAWASSSDWVVSCDTCREQVVIDFGEPYFCPTCLNAAHGGKARVVIYPDAEKRAEIESILLKRPDPNTRNWLVTESPDDLRKENALHGIGDN